MISSKMSVPGISLWLALLFLSLSCRHEEPAQRSQELAIRVRHDLKGSWDACVRQGCFGDPQGILPIGAFSSLVVAGLTEEADRVVNFVVDSLDFYRDMEVMVKEMSTTVLGGLLSMYQLSGDEQILEKARDFAERFMPAFDSSACLPEMGMLSYYTGDPRYYQAARRSVTAICQQCSDAGCPSCFESLYKGWLLFGDPELKEIWEAGVGPHGPHMEDAFMAHLKAQPDRVESAWYLWELTGERVYLDMLKKHERRLRDCKANKLTCKTLQGMRDRLYLYLAFSDQEMYTLSTVVFSTQGHPFLKAALDPDLLRKHLDL